MLGLPNKRLLKLFRFLSDSLVADVLLVVVHRLLWNILWMEEYLF